MKLSTWARLTSFWMKGIQSPIFIIVILLAASVALAGCYDSPSKQEDTQMRENDIECLAFSEITRGQAIDAWWGPTDISGTVKIEVSDAPNENHGLSVSVNKRPTTVGPGFPQTEPIVQYNFVSLDGHSFVNKLTLDPDDEFHKPVELSYPFILEYNIDHTEEIGLVVQYTGSDPLLNVTLDGIEMRSCQSFEKGQTKAESLPPTDSPNVSLDPHTATFNTAPGKHPSIGTLCAFRTGGPVSPLGESLRLVLEVTHPDGRENTFDSGYSITPSQSLDAEIPYGFCHGNIGIALEQIYRAEFEGNSTSATVHVFWMYSESTTPLSIDV